MNPGARIMNLLVCMAIIAILIGMFLIPAYRGGVRFATNKHGVIQTCVSEWKAAMEWDTK